MQTWLNKLLNVRHGEWSRLLLLSAILLLSNLGPGWGTPVVYAAFLKQVGLKAGLETLVWVILLSSILSIPAMAIYGTFVDRLDNNKMFVYIVASEGVVILLSMLFLAMNMPGFAYPFLYILSLAASAVFIPHFFTYVNEVYDIQSAKRAMPLILAAGRIGSILAGFTLQPLTVFLNEQALIWIWLTSDAVVIGIIILIPYVINNKKKAQGESTYHKVEDQDKKPKISSVQSLQEVLQFTLQSQFLRWMAIGTLLLTALMTLLEYDFNKIMIPMFQSPMVFAGVSYSYAGFLGLLNGASNLVAMIVLLFVISRVTKTWGVANTSLIFPITSLLISSGLAGFPTIIPASLAHLNRKGLRFSLLSPVESLLYNAIPLRVKGRARAFIGGQVAPIGAIFGVLLLVIDLVYGITLPWMLASLIVLLALAYLFSAVLIRSEYTQALVKMLEEEDYSFLLAEGASELVVADPATLQRLQKKLEESVSHEMRIFMTQLIAQVGGTESLAVLIPSIKATPEARTRAAMLNVLTAAGLHGDKLRELFVDLLVDADAQVRQAAASGLEQLLGAKDRWLQDQLLEMINDPDVQVSQFALQSLSTTGDFYKLDAAVQKLNQLIQSDELEQKKNAIDILGKIAQPQAIEQILGFLSNENDQLRLQAMIELEAMSLPIKSILDEKIVEGVRPLAQDSVARVRQAAIHVLGKYKNRTNHAVFINALSDQTPQVRTAAVETLVSIGKDVTTQIQAQLKEPNLQTQNVAAVALSQINPLQFSALIETKLDDNLRMIYQNIGIEQVLSVYDKYRSVRVLLAAMRETNREQVDEILYLLSANHAPDIIKVVRDSLDSDSASTRNLALEALESMATPRIAALIASLFEPSLTPAQRQELGQDSLNVQPLTLVQAFEKLLSEKEARILVLLALEALGEIGAGTPQSQKPLGTIKISRLFQTLENQPEASQQPSSVLPRELIILLEKSVNSVDPLVKQAAQTAFKKITATDNETETNETAPTTQDQAETISVVERVIILKETHFFRNIPISQLESLALVCKERRFKKDTRIFGTGEPGGVLYVVVDGQVAIEQEKRIGSTLLATIENNSYFGEMSLFDNSPRSASAITLKDSLVLELNRAPIITLTMQNPDLALELIKVLSQRIRETSDKMAEAARSRPRELHKLYDQFDN